MRRRRPDESISLRDLILSLLPAVALTLLAFWVAFQFVRPAPPDTVVISSGAPGGAYHVFAERYRTILARHGITLEIRPSAGSVENLQRLRDEGSGVDVAFVQTGMGSAAENAGLMSLGSLYYEPVWVFYSSESTLDRLIQLTGKRVAVGPEGSGTRLLARMLLEGNELREPLLTLLPRGGEELPAAFKRGDIDAAFVVAAPEAEVVRKLMTDPDIKLMSFALADAYGRHFPFLTRVTLPQGSYDLVREYPRADTQMFATNATLVARESLHPALVNVLLQAATEVHSGPGLFHGTRAFPGPKDSDFPLSTEAGRFYQSGTPFLQRYLPFWVAALADRLVVMLVPLFAVLVPLVRIMPGLYSWRVRSRIYRWYGELKFLEQDIHDAYDPARHDEYLDRLDRIEERANRRAIPLAFNSELYTLREHINLVRSKLEHKRATVRP